MSVSIPDPQVGQPTFAIDIVARPAPAVAQALADLQDQIEAFAPAAALHRVPVSALHLSVYQLAWTRTPQIVVGPHDWAALEAATLAALRALSAPYPAFALQQAQLRVGDKAIYLQFSPDPALERLRDDMDGYAASRFPDRNRPQIQHITLFRSREALPLAPLVQACSALPAWQQTWRIDQLELVHETAYPLLAGRLVGDWPLRG